MLNEFIGGSSTIVRKQFFNQGHKTCIRAMRIWTRRRLPIRSQQEIREVVLPQTAKLMANKEAESIG
jgi:hypothetical protein